MNDRQLVRNQGRIPRLLFHIERVKNKPGSKADKEKRIAGFKDELHRRCLEMELAGYKDLCDRLLKVKLHPQKQVTLPTTAVIQAYLKQQAAA